MICCCFLIVAVDIVVAVDVAYVASSTSGVVVAICSSRSRDRARYIARERSAGVECSISR